jgi:arylsulfatase A-like enzyme
MDGRSLLEGPNRKVVLTEFYSRKGRTFPKWASLRTRRYQYVEYYAPDGRRIVFREYYDLTSDPWENDNLLKDGKTPDALRTGSLHRTLDRLRGCSGRSCP